MNFANMSPADRMKASGLIGLIVVILFFVVHTMLGSVGPKKPAGLAQDGAAPGQTAASAAGPPVPAAGPAPAAPAQPGEDFPVGRVVASKDSISKALQVDPGNPFIQIPKAKDHKMIASARGTDGDVEVHPVGGFGSYDGMQPVGDTHVPAFPGVARTGSLPPLSPGSVGVGAPGPLGVLPPAQPEIRVVGIVHGNQSVATMQVGTRVMIARPMDILYPGWRMTSVTSEGVRIRHEGNTELVRVGSVLNDKAERPDVKQ